MSEKTAKNRDKTDNSPALTIREQEVLNLLLAGSVPKEIANILNISHSTVLDHKKNIYGKLDVHSINELLIKYAAKKKEILAERIDTAKAVFNRWDLYEDDLGSHINLMPKVELIQDSYTETNIISGNLSYKDMACASANAFPDPSTLEVMIKMERFSFTCLGDGKTYVAMLPTTEARLEGGNNYYGKQFATENGVISTFSFFINELVQSPLIGKKVPFVQNSIESFMIQIHSKGDFNLKFWDIRFY